MLILGMKPGHDGSIGALQDGNLLFSYEGEKDSYPRFESLHPEQTVQALLSLPDVPDVVAISGWERNGIGPGLDIGAGYEGWGGEITNAYILGRKARVYSSSHEQAHIMMAIGMAPVRDSDRHVVLVWEGDVGSFYVLNEHFVCLEKIDVLRHPGSKYSFLFALCDPAFDARVERIPRLSDAGKLMALAAFGRSENCSKEIRDTVSAILALPKMSGPVPKEAFRASPLYNCGVQSQACKDAARLISDVIFRRFAEVALANIPAGNPLYIAGGCGLNCEWNHAWRTSGHFSSVDVAPTCNDSGAAIGTMIDARRELTGNVKIDWSVYSGQEFVWDVEVPAHWESVAFNRDEIVTKIHNGSVFAWVNGRYEIGPRALGNRSLLADARMGASKDLLNSIKQREDYRPIAPCVLLEDCLELFGDDFEDPHMLFFRRFRSREYDAVRHVDGSARVQTVTDETNPELHKLLVAVKHRIGRGILCNTSLNFNGFGFINKASDLFSYADSRGLENIVVDGVWYVKARS